LKIRTTVEFSGVPKGTTGNCVEEPEEEWHKGKRMWKVEWDLPLKYFGTKLKPLTDWFDDGEFKKFLVKI